MPFTVGGEWIPSKKSDSDAPKASQKPVKVRLVKRGNNVITTILNLTKSPKELSTLASAIKKRLGSGGAVQEQTIEIQGDKVAEVKKILDEIGIKSS
jgi:translation initiation factor 1